MIELGLREGIWALVAILTLYLVVILFRLAIPRRSADSSDSSAPPKTLLAEPPAAEPLKPPPPPEPDLTSSPEEEAVSRDLLNELEIQQLRRDVAQLRTESDFLRRELAATRRDVDELRDARQASRERVEYARPVSPQHSEAMLLAGRGFEASRIAEHCGISVAEAELVCALARAEEGR